MTFRQNLAFEDPGPSVEINLPEWGAMSVGRGGGRTSSHSEDAEDTRLRGVRDLPGPGNALAAEMAGPRACLGTRV